MRVTQYLGGITLIGLAASAAWGCSSAGRQQRVEGPRPQDPASLCSDLGSPHPGVAYSASRSLFELADEALPSLFVALTDERPYHGGCGSSALESTFSLGLGRGGRPTGGSPFRVGDHALYLVEAISRGDFYFRYRCYMGVPTKVREGIKARLLQLGSRPNPAERYDDVLRVIGEFQNELDWR